VGPARPDSAPAPALPFGFAPSLLVSFLLSTAITFNRGAYSEGALTLIFIALAVLVFCLSESARRLVPIQRNPRTTLVLVWLGAFAMAWYAWNDDVLIYPALPWTTGKHAQVAVLVLLASYLPFLTGRLREANVVRLARFAAIAAAITVAGVDVIRVSPAPRIDVWTVQQAGAAALLAKKNPYTAVAERDTGPRVAEDVPYVYPPTQIYLTAPAYALGRDVRFTMLAAIVLAGVGMRYITGRAGSALPSIALDGPALYLWSMTKLFFILEQAWVDPVQVMLIVMTLAAYVGRRRWLTAVLLGVVLSSKQTMFWAVALTGVSLRFNRRQWLTTALVGFALVLPFIVLDFRALKHANFDFLSGLPSRPDALTFNSWYLHHFDAELPGSIGFFLAGIVAALAMWRMRGTAARLALSLATTYSFFFAFNKWAFSNYYFMMASLAALSAAAACHAVGAGSSEPEV